MSTRQDLSVMRGTTVVLQFTVDNLPSTGLQGFSFWFTAKYRLTDPDASAVIAKTTPDFAVVAEGSATNPGLVKLTLAPADTAGLPDYDVELRYDFQVKDQAGNPTVPVYGILTVSPHATKATA